MKNYKFKFMNEAHITELDKLWNDGHNEALFAFGAECVNCYKEKHNRFATGAFIAGGLTAVAVTVGKKVYHKLKEKKEEPKPWEKPGRDWEV